MTLYAVLSVLLFRYSNQTNFVVGTLTAGRHKKQFEQIIGFFINNLLLKTEFSGSTSFVDLLKQAKVTCLDAYQHQDVPFEKIIELLDVPRERSRAPIFQVLLVLQNVGAGDGFRLGGVEGNSVNFDYEVAKFDLTFEFMVKDGCLIGSIQYATDLFLNDRIARMVVHFCNILKTVHVNPTCSVNDIPILTDDELTNQLVLWNSTKQPYNLQESYIERFEAQVEKSPVAVAARCGDQSISYRELNSAANTLAFVLLDKGIGKTDIVAIALERGINLLIAMLAVLKSGAAFISLAFETPSKRNRAIVEATKSPCIISDRQHQDVLQKFALNPTCIYLDQLLGENRQVRNPNIKLHPTDLAYVIFTSGSTGQPKGAKTEHQGFLNHLLAMQSKLDLNSNDVMAQNASLRIPLAES